MNKRYIGAVIYLIPTLLIIVLGGNFLRYGLMIMSLMGLNEFYNALRKKNMNPFGIIGYVSTIFYYYYLGKSIEPVFLGFLVMSVVMVLLVLPMLYEKRTIVDSAVTLFGILYVSALISLIYLIGAKENGVYLIWVIFISSWSCDTMAYFVGKNIGKIKIAPRISPNKSLEGSIGGFLSSTIAVGIYGYIIINFFSININLFHFIMIGLLCGVLNQIGDLTASSIKRNMDIKDFSNLIPGHGGILDRFDSIIFASAVVYYYISIIIGM
ncbi:phosphatidate cytidylyltransferase [Oceanirhabdus seepicola]|uniref:Phosphatidate cytidylyltransferase n=1 Tax=Oceanirhabdus seepicola TaxID=2828781 RepID=A0A9J6P3J4_9CLOT|nr:phosphatidate cytidylyltransferase [Oceanirhabdus seepicola]MCM1991107.1 phosphatidate cytidylyltransferase [Oceanirhabdus seepicola]